MTMNIEPTEGGKRARVVEPTVAMEEEKEESKVAKPTIVMEEDQGESNAMGSRVTLKSALSRPNRFFPCGKDPAYLDLCQEHYLVMWHSGTRKYSDYQKDAYKGNSTDFTYILHTS